MLRLAPGTYRVADLDVRLHDGTPMTRLRVTAADPARPPVVNGALVLQDPDYWDFDHLKVEGSITPYNALRINGGSHWTIQRSEFRGTAGWTSEAVLNVASYHRAAPESFTIAYNCFHHGPIRPPSVHDHLVYVTSFYRPTTSHIARNVLFRNPNGAAIKLNSGNVKVNYNTIANAAGAVTVQDNAEEFDPVARVGTSRNLVQTMRPLREGPGYLHVFWANRLNQNRTAGPKWRIKATYVYSRNGPRYLFRGYSRPRTVNVVGGEVHTTDGKPDFTKPGTCNGCRPTYGPATKYGRYAGDGVSLVPPG